MHLPFPGELEARNALLARMDRFRDCVQKAAYLQLVSERLSEVGGANNVAAPVLQFSGTAVGLPAADRVTLKVEPFSDGKPRPDGDVVIRYELHVGSQGHDYKLLQGWCACHRGMLDLPIPRAGVPRGALPPEAQVPAPGMRVHLSWGRQRIEVDEAIAGDDGAFGRIEAAFDKVSEILTQDMPARADRLAAAERAQREQSAERARRIIGLLAATQQECAAP